jgi:hypothetical protein
MYIDAIRLSFDKAGHAPLYDVVIINIKIKTSLIWGYFCDRGLSAFEWSAIIILSLCQDQGAAKKPCFSSIEGFS